MPNPDKNAKITPLIGLQWGDEGKGKGVARIASGLTKNDLIVRFQRGNNAGHTIWRREKGKVKCYVFHLIPSGVFGSAQIHLGAGMGIPPSLIGSSIGIFKAYVTKVGEGPFPTELGGEQSAHWCRDKKFAEEKARFPNPDPNSKSEFERGIVLRRLGSEIGATTGRLRRTGWLDIPLLKYAIRMNDADKLVLTKLDILDNFKKIKACTHYLIGSKKTSDIPFDLSREKIKCVYKSFPLWQGKLSDYGRKLPKEALNYVKFLEKELGAKIIYVGTGPEEQHVVERYWR